MVEILETFNALQKLITPVLSSGQRFTLANQIDLHLWDTLLTEANQQDIASYLYTLLHNLHQSHNLELPEMEILHQSYLLTAARNTLALKDAGIILSAFTRAGISAVGLKGIFLLEHVYPDIGARAMNDIDLLVKKHDLPRCLEVMQELGYKTTTYFNLADKNIDTKHVPPMEKPGCAVVELHWTLLEENQPFTLDADAIWERTLPTKISGADAFALGVEDLILHLCLHLTYQHFLNLGLRGLMDIALVIHKYRPEIDWHKLVEIARSWGVERVAALTLKLVDSQLNVHIPSEVVSALVPEGIETDLLEKAQHQLLERVWFDDHFTPDLVEMSASKNLFAKIKIGLQRIFIPRNALARIYNVPPSSPRIMGFYWARLNYLIRNYGKTILRVERGEAKTEPARQKAEISKSLHEWMSSRK